MSDLHKEKQSIYQAIKAKDELDALRSQLTAANERIEGLEKVIKAAIEIKDLWTLKDVESMFEDEAKALQIMLTNFEQALTTLSTEG